MKEWFKNILYYIKIAIKLARRNENFYKILADIINKEMSKHAKDETILKNWSALRRLCTSNLIEKCNDVIEKGEMTKEQFKAIDKAFKMGIIMNRTLHLRANEIRRFTGIEIPEIFIKDGEQCDYCGVDSENNLICGVEVEDKFRPDLLCENCINGVKFTNRHDEWSND